MPEYPPFITDANENLVVTNGTDDDRAITINQGESAFLTCPQENFIDYPSETTLQIRQGFFALLESFIFDASADVTQLLDQCSL